MSKPILSRPFACFILLSLGVALVASSARPDADRNDPPTIGGCVVDVDGNPLAGVVVYVKRGLANVTRCENQPCVTDKNGHYSIVMDTDEARKLDPVKIEFGADVRNGKNPPYRGTEVEALITHKGPLQINVALPDRKQATGPQIRTEADIVFGQIDRLIGDKPDSNVRDLYGHYLQDQIAASRGIHLLDLDNELLAIDRLIERDATPLAFSVYANTLLGRTGSGEGTLLVGWPLEKGEPWSVHVHAPVADFKTLPLSRDEALLAASVGNSLSFWRVPNQGTPESIDEKLPPLAEAQGAVALARDGDNGEILVASAGSNGTVTVRRLKSAQPRKALSTGSGAVRALTFSRDGKLLAAVSLDGTVSLWDLGRGSNGEVLTGHLGIPCANCLAFSPDGDALAVGGGLVGKGSVVLIPLDLVLKERERDIDLGQLGVPSQTEAGVTTVAFTGKRRLLAAMNTSTVASWDIDDKNGLIEEHIVAEGVIGSFALTPDGKQVGLIKKEGDKPYLLSVP